MISNKCVDIHDFIMKFKNSELLCDAWREFNQEWLFNISNNNQVSVVRSEYECMEFEMVHGDGEYDKAILQTFISCLEKLYE